MSTILTIIIFFFIGRAVLKWARGVTEEQKEGLAEIIEYLKEDKEAAKEIVEHLKEEDDDDD